MSFSDWYSRNTPLVIVILSYLVVVPTIWWLSSESAYEAGYEQQATNRAKNDAEKQFESACARLTTPEAIVDCFREEIRTARDYERPEEDLRAQKQMAKWALGVLVATIAVGLLTTAVAYIGVRYVRDTLNETRRLGRAEIRAYLTCVEAEYDVRDRWLTCTMWVQNDGQSPAKDIRLDAKLTLHIPEKDPESGELINPPPAKIPTGNKRDFIAIGGKEMVPFNWGDPIGDRDLVDTLRGGPSIFYVDCLLSWKDVFGGRQTLTIYLYPIGDRTTHGPLIGKMHISHNKPSGEE